MAKKRFPSTARSRFGLGKGERLDALRRRLRVRPRRRDRHSPDKIHAHGPVGLEELSSPKWIVLGNGALRE
jgi:hypothetical protein